MALLLLRLELLLVTIDFPEVKSTPNPLCFDSRVWSCPLLVSISAYGMIVWVHDVGLVAMNVDFEH